MGKGRRHSERSLLREEVCMCEREREHKSDKKEMRRREGDSGVEKKDKEKLSDK